jgi:hypothetical protein
MYKIIHDRADLPRLLRGNDDIVFYSYAICPCCRFRGATLYTEVCDTCKNLLIFCPKCNQIQCSGSRLTSYYLYSNGEPMGVTLILKLVDRKGSPVPISYTLLPRRGGRQNQPPPMPSPPKTSPLGQWSTCAKCSSKVKTKNLREHMAKMHPETLTVDLESLS